MAWREAFNDIDAYARYLGDAYEEASVKMLAIIRRRLETGADAPDWAVKKLAEYRAVLRDLKREIPELSSEITDMVDKAYLAGAKEAADEVKALSMPSLEPLARGSAVKALALEAVEATNATKFRVLRETMDSYRDVIARVAAEHLTGGSTIRKTVQEGLRDLADRGICGFIDSAGKRWTLPSYVEMAVRSSSANAAREGHSNKLEAAGVDLVRVSRFGATCESCGPWEGRILSLTGKTKGYPTIAEASADSHLFGPNCKHHYTAYIPGVSPDHNPQDVPHDPEAYQAQQKERYNERMIRQWKRRSAIAITDDEKKLCAAKVKAWQKAQREHIKSTNEWYSAKYGPGTQLLWRKYEREKP